MIWKVPVFCKMIFSPIRRLFLISPGILLLLIVSPTNSEDSRAIKAKWCGGGQTPVGRPCNASNPCPDELNMNCGQNEQCECPPELLWSDKRCYCTYRAAAVGCTTSRHCVEGSRCYHTCRYPDEPRECEMQGTCDCCEGDNQGNMDGICPLVLCPGESDESGESYEANVDNGVAKSSVSILILGIVAIFIIPKMS